MGLLRPLVGCATNNSASWVCRADCLDDATGYEEKRRRSGGGRWLEWSRRACGDSFWGRVKTRWQDRTTRDSAERRTRPWKADRAIARKPGPEYGLCERQTFLKVHDGELCTCLGCKDLKNRTVPPEEVQSVGVCWCYLHVYISAYTEIIETIRYSGLHTLNF